jgi:hypothetical protein
MSAVETPSVVKHAKRTRRTKATSDLPCQICSFPLSDRHHLLPFSKFGNVFDDNDAAFAFLCPNCHRIYHVIDDFAFSIPRRQQINGVISAAQNGAIARHQLPELFALVIKARTSQISASNGVLDIIKQGSGDPNLVSHFLIIIAESEIVIEQCTACLSKLKHDGLIPRSLWEMALGGVMQ